MDAPDGYRYLLRGVEASVRTRAGSAQPVEVQARVGVLHDARPELPDVAWNSDRTPFPFRSGFFLSLEAGEALALREQGAWLAVTAVIEVQRSRVVARLPVDSRATTVVRGARIRVHGVQMEHAAFEAVVSRVFVDGKPESFGIPGESGDRMSFVLLDGDRPTAHAATVAGNNTSTVFGLVLPGVRAGTQSLMLGARVPGATAPHGSELRGRSLLVVEWTPLRSYTETLRLSVVQGATGTFPGR
jgi:hypothetical protein